MQLQWLVCASFLTQGARAYAREADGRVMVDSAGVSRLMRSQSTGVLPATNPYTKQKGVDGPPGAPHDQDVVTMGSAPPPPAASQTAQLIWTSRLISAGVAVVLGLLGALLYRRIKKWPKVSEQPTDLKQWSSGHFACFSDLPTCCVALWCPCIRWGDTMDMASIIAFWPAAMAFLFLFTSDLLLPVPVFALILVILMTYGRQRLRKGFEMESGDCKSICGDCLFVSFCTPCAISQEARHIEKAAEVNHPLVAPRRPLEVHAQGEASAPAQGEMSRGEAPARPDEAASAPPPAAAASAPSKKEEPDSDEEF